MSSLLDLTTQGDVATISDESRLSTVTLMTPGELYRLWERQNWRAHELDFSVDREQWLASPTEAQEHTTWSLGSFYIGEERVTADLAPFLLAAPPFSLSTKALGLLFLTYVTGAVVTPLAGRGIDAYGHRAVLVGALGLCACGALLPFNEASRRRATAA